MMTIGINNMDSICFSCQGESHIAAGKVCQDYSYSCVYGNGDAIAIVCDGHGGKRYFRSDIGARIAAEVTERNVRIFLNESGSNLLKGQPFTSRSSLSDQIKNQEFSKLTEADKALRQLFSAIIYEWNSCIAEHAKSNPITDSERQSNPPEWIEEFTNGINLEKVYGCTLIAYASTTEFWLAFQIGDGKCFAFDTDGQWSEPIPWDDRCFLNKTTSICDSTAIDEFRYCYDGDGRFPIAMILGSDGIDDSFGAEENQANFYVQILKSIAKDGIDATEAEIRATLPQLSKIGSQDDMSIAMIFDHQKTTELFPRLVEWQISNIARQVAEEESRIAIAEQIKHTVESIDSPTQQDLIEQQYADIDIRRASENRIKLQRRLDALSDELNATK